MKLIFVNQNLNLVSGFSKTPFTINSGKQPRSKKIIKRMSKVYFLSMERRNTPPKLDKRWSFNG
jgi:hypothetical protein